MLKRLRIVFLLYVLAFVAVGNYLTSLRTTDWDTPLWVDVHPINADGSPRTQAYIDGLQNEDFAPLETFLRREAERYQVAVDPPFRITLAPQVHDPLPQLATQPSMLTSLWWSLRMRWFVAKLHWLSDRPTPDITLFAVYHGDTSETTLDRSTALRKGLIAVANVFADRTAAGGNHLVMAHELLHTVGASDKYVAGSNMPRFPDGYADPDAKPLHPQTAAEIMGGRIPLDSSRAKTPSSLDRVVVGPVTAAEIGWLSRSASQSPR